jgi:hypothetical protein
MTASDASPAKTRTASPPDGVWSRVVDLAAPACNTAADVEWPVNASIKAQQAQSAEHPADAERDSDRPGNDGLVCERREFIEVAQKRDEEREQEEHGHRGAQAADSEPSPPAFALEPHHDGKPADHHDSHGDCAGAAQAEVEAVAREQVNGGDPNPDRQSGRDRKKRLAASASVSPAAANSMAVAIR